MNGDDTTALRWLEEFVIYGQRLPADDPYLTIKDICSELRLSHETVRKWILDGRLPHVKAGRQYRVRRSDLQRMLAAGGSSGDEGESGAEALAPNAMRSGAELAARFAP